MRQDKPLVSVIVPLYNKREYVISALKSIVAQTFDSLEIIVVNDGSTDDGATLAKDFLASVRYHSIVVDNRNSGQAVTRNLGASLACGKYLAFLDADDVWHSQKLEIQIRMLESNTNFSLCLTNYFMFPEEKKLAKSVSLNPLRRNVRNWLNTSGVGGLFESTGLIRRDVFEDIGGLNNSLDGIAGLDLVVKLHRLGMVCLANNHLCGYRVLSSGAHNDKTKKLLLYQQLLASSPEYLLLKKEVDHGLRMHLVILKLRYGMKGNAILLLLDQIWRFPKLTVRYLYFGFHKTLFGYLAAFFRFRRLNELKKSL